MDRAELEKKVMELATMAFKREITIDTKVKEDMGKTSMNMVALLSEIENELDTDPLEIPTAAACDTMKELIDLVEENL